MKNPDQYQRAELFPFCGELNLLNYYQSNEILDLAIREDIYNSKMEALGLVDQDNILTEQGHAYLKASLEFFEPISPYTHINEIYALIAYFDLPLQISDNIIRPLGGPTWPLDTPIKELAEIFSCL